MTTTPYARVVPLYRPLGPRDTEHERLMKHRYPPTGDVAAWVRGTPEQRARDRHAQLIAEHEHTAAAPGADCAICQFPWWP